MDLLPQLIQFGAAGLMGWMWLAERRDAAERDKQLAESHRALMQEREKLDVLVAALESNTRAITSLELGQRRLVDLFNRVPIPPVPPQITPDEPRTK